MSALNDAIAIVAKQMGLPEKTIRAVYYGYCDFVIATISELPLDRELTEEEFNSFRKTFNFKTIGAFTIKYRNYKAIWARRNWLKANGLFNVPKKHGRRKKEEEHIEGPIERRVLEQGKAGAGDGSGGDVQEDA